jgi:hypothetical protein
VFGRLPCVWHENGVLVMVGSVSFAGVRGSHGGHGGGGVDAAHVPVPTSASASVLKAVHDEPESVPSSLAESSVSPFAAPHAAPHAASFEPAPVTHMPVAPDLAAMSAKELWAYRKETPFDTTDTQLREGDIVFPLQPAGGFGMNTAATKLVQGARAGFVTPNNGLYTRATHTQLVVATDNKGVLKNAPYQLADGKVGVLHMGQQLAKDGQVLTQKGEKIDSFTGGDKLASRAGGFLVARPKTEQARQQLLDHAAQRVALADEKGNIKGGFRFSNRKAALSIPKRIVGRRGLPMSLNLEHAAIELGAYAGRVGNAMFCSPYVAGVLARDSGLQTTLLRLTPGEYAGQLAMRPAEYEMVYVGPEGAKPASGKATKA